MLLRHSEFISEYFRNSKMLKQVQHDDLDSRRDWILVNTKLIFFYR